MNFSIGRTFLIVTASALAGMVLGGLFGYASGRVAPDLFMTLIPWKPIEPVGSATFLGAFGGVLCGGALGAFAILAQLAWVWLHRAGRPNAG